MPAQDEHVLAAVAARRRRSTGRCRGSRCRIPGKRRDDPAHGRGATDVAGSASWDGLPVYLFDGQAIPQGSWVTADEAGCVVWPGITRLGVAGYG